MLLWLHFAADLELSKYVFFGSGEHALVHGGEKRAAAAPQT